MLKSSQLLWLALATSSLLGCSDKKTWSRGEITNIADEAIDARQAGADTRFTELEARVKLLEESASANYKFTRAVAKQVDGNAKVANENALKDMTRRGACGYRADPGPAGGMVYSPIQCTEADLAK